MSTCIICCLPYNTSTRIPVSLQCLHTICKLCVNSMFDNNNSSSNINQVNNNIIECPLCRLHCNKQYIKTNYALYDLLYTTHHMLCHECMDASTISTSRCISCNIDLCNYHSDIHSQWNDNTDNVNDNEHIIRHYLMTEKHLSNNIENEQQCCNVM